VADLTPIAAKLAKYVRLLGSDRKGEIAAAFHALKRTLESAGADFNDLGNRVECPPSALMRQIGWVEEGRISGSS